MASYTDDELKKILEIIKYIYTNAKKRKLITKSFKDFIKQEVEKKNCPECLLMMIE